MIDQRERITIFRQIGSMMEAGVDILRITRVLRAQTDDTETLQAFDTLDHALRMGQSLSDAMENVPAMFSPFAVSLVRQGEARNDIAGAWHKIADFMQKEGETDVAHESNNAATASPANPSAVMTPSALLPVWVIDDLINRAQVAALRIFTLIAGLLLTLAAVWGSVEAGFVERRWQNVVLSCVAALFIGGAGVWLRRRIDRDRSREIERRLDFEAEVAAQDAAESTSVAASGTPVQDITDRRKKNSVAANSLEKINPPREATFD